MLNVLSLLTCGITAFRRSLIKSRSYVKITCIFLFDNKKGQTERGCIICYRLNSQKTFAWGLWEVSRHRQQQDVTKTWDRLRFIRKLCTKHYAAIRPRYTHYPIMSTAFNLSKLQHDWYADCVKYQPFSFLSPKDFTFATPTILHHFFDHNNSSFFGQGCS